MKKRKLLSLILALFMCATLVVACIDVSVDPCPSDCQDECCKVECSPNCQDECCKQGNGPTQSQNFNIFFQGGSLNGVVAPVMLPPIVAKEGTEISAPANPVWAGRGFRGWFASATDTEPFDFDLMPGHNVTLIARWVMIWTIRFDVTDVNGNPIPGYDIPNMEVEQGARVTVGQLPVLKNRVGWAFENWRVGNRIGSPFATQVIDGDRTLFASWIAGSTITFAGPGIEVGTFMVAPAGSQINAPPIPQRAGHSFARWTHLVAGQPRIFDFTTMPHTDTVVSAEWTQALTLPILNINLRSSTAITTPAAGAPAQARNQTIPLQSVNNPNYNSGNSCWIWGYVSVDNAGEWDLEPNRIQFRGRGSGSWIDGFGVGSSGMPAGGNGTSNAKPGYRFRFPSSSSDWRSMVGMPTNRSWLLVSGANFNDRTMLGNHSVYSFSREVLDNIPYATRSEMVELVVNGLYRGVYMLVEHGRPVHPNSHPDHPRDEFTRVPVRATGNANTGFDLNSDFLIEYDIRADGDRRGAGNNSINRTPWARFLADANVVPAGQRVDDRWGRARHHIEIIYPDPDVVGSSMTDRDMTRYDNYWALNRAMRTFMSNVMFAIFSGNETMFNQLADLDSFVDFYIIQELAKNGDAGWSSVFFHRSNGKLYASFPWDFDCMPRGGGGGHDRARGLGTGAEIGRSSGFYIAAMTTGALTANCSEMFFVLTQTPWFRNAVRARWAQISANATSFVTSHFNHYINNAADSFGRDWQFWGPLGGRGTHSTVQSGANAWRTQAENKRDWLLARITWLSSSAGFAHANWNRPVV